MTIIRKSSERISSCEDALALLGAETRTKKESDSNKPVVNKSLDKNCSFRCLLVVLILLVVYFFPSSNIVENKPVDEDSTTTTIQKDTVEQITNNDLQQIDEIERQNSEIKTTPNEDNSQENIVKNDVVSDENNDKVITSTENNTVDNIIEYGSLNVECIPWAKVFIDSVEYDTTPIEDPIMTPSRKNIL